MRQLHSITRSLPLRSSSIRAAATPLLTLANRHQYSTATETARPKILDPAGAFDGKPRDAEKHNRDFEHRGEAGPAGKVASAEGSVKKPGPKIHNTAGVFDGEKRDVERHNREFRERHDRGGW
ncbi:hypothetical protein TWF730_007798 [Orbilia blumenaviensis]|uniref:Uncharacterized protein n=1 Tax=Orbilia blumenaviensis TaxID=1796055 RepID=A0AAV9V9C7_9PEZI